SASVDPLVQAREAQELLNAMGYAAGIADGVAGARTQSAIASFREARDVAGEGIDEALLVALRCAEADGHRNPNPSGAVARPAGTVVRDCGECPELVVLPAGSFLMGSPSSERQRNDDEGPQRSVSIRSFAIGPYEVTFDEYEA